MVGVNTNLVGQNESSGLEGPLFGDGRPLDVGSHSDSGRALSGGIDSTRCDLLDVFQKLGLCRARVSAKENVDVTANLVLVLN